VVVVLAAVASATKAVKLNRSVWENLERHVRRTKWLAIRQQR
jgi:hypothetical protein